jgi:hypothetical protein
MSSSLWSLTPFWNFNSTGLNPANSLFTCLLEWSSLLTRTSNLLQIQKNLQHNLHKTLLNLYSLCNLCIHLLYFSNLQFLLLHWRNRPLNHNLLQTYSPLPDQVGYNLKPTNLICNLARISTTKNSTQASSKDAENFVAKQRPWSPSWHQDHSCQNNPLCILLLKT